jgi:hypothetical protein
MSFLRLHKNFRYILTEIVFLYTVAASCAYARQRVDVIYRQGSAARDFPLAVKTNLLYDAALLPNVGVEAPLGLRWSVAVYGAFSRWDTKRPHYWSHQVNDAGVEGRRWLGSGAQGRLNGWFAGAYFTGGVYDLRLFTDDSEDYGYLSRWSRSAGVSGGYSLALSRRWTLEFNLKVGYLTGRYSAYNRSRFRDCYPERYRGVLHYTGPTGGGVSLVYRIGRPNREAAGKTGHTHKHNGPL